MSVAQLIAEQQRDQILGESIEQQRQLVLTFNSRQGWRTFKSSFASGSVASRVMLVSTPIPRDGSAFEPPEPGAALGVTFRLGHKKCMFGTTLEPTHGPTACQVISLRWPDHLQQLQRRVYERARPVKDAIIPVRFWREEGPSGTPVEKRTVRHGQLENLSVGGMRVKTANPKEIGIGQTCRCVFAPGAGRPSFILDALVRHHEAVDQGRASIGFQFVGLEATPEGRRLLEQLARTVSQFHRARSRSRR